MSSRVKQPIAEAKEFASTLDQQEGEQQPQPDDGPTNDATGGGDAPSECPATIQATSVSEEEGSKNVRPTLISDGDEPIAYASEQAQLNVGLRDQVLGVEAEGVSLSERCEREIRELRRLATDDIQNKRNTVMNNYTNLFKWPPIDDTAPKELAEQNKLQVPPVDVHGDVVTHKEFGTGHLTAIPLLEELSRPVPLLKRRQELKEKLTPVSVQLLKDQEITEQLLLQLHDLAQGDVFSVTRLELDKTTKAIEALLETLQSTSAAKEDALMTNDVRAAETYALREIDITEKIIDENRKRIEIIFQSDNDVKEFCDRYQKVQESAEKMLAVHQDSHEQLITALDNDQTVLQKSGEAAQDKAEEAEVAYTKELEDIKIKLRTNTQAQQQNWDQILALLEANKTLTKQREALVTKQLSKVAEEHHRIAQHDAFMAGNEAYLQEIVTARRIHVSALEWVHQIRRYVDTNCAQIENKKIDEEAWNMRVQEQLAYLDSYKQFKSFVDDVSHRKELRVMSLQRAIRNLQLQIDEAVQTLDPNKKKYEQEVQTSQKEVAQITSMLEQLAERAKEQKQRWRVVEESLEEAQVEFVPPDISAEKALCDKKTQALAVARQYVVTEQETVDKDTMKLRKLKTSNQVALDGLQKRRAERITSSPVAAATPPAAADEY